MRFLVTNRSERSIRVFTMLVVLCSLSTARVSAQEGFIFSVQREGSHGLGAHGHAGGLHREGTGHLHDRGRALSLLAPQ